MYDIVAEKEMLEEIRRSLEEDADYPAIVSRSISIILRYLRYW